MYPTISKLIPGTKGEKRKDPEKRLTWSVEAKKWSMN